MFKNPHFETRGVAAEIPYAIRHFLWQCVGAMPEPRDYLQVFQLSPCGPFLRITHSSEEPAYHMEYLLLYDEPLNQKIYVIDSEDYSTMLLASEY